jgi:hypothetical protein
MATYITELNDFLTNLIKEYNNDYLEYFDKIENVEKYKRINIGTFDDKVIRNINIILKKVHKIEKENILYNNIKYNEFLCLVMVLFRDLNDKNNIDLFKKYGFALRSIFVKSNNLQNDLILF